MSRGPRQPTIAPGIYPDALGFEARINVKGKPYAKRFPPDHPLPLMQAWQADERAYRLRCAQDDAAQQPTVVRGTLAGDVAHYLETRVGRPGYKADRSHFVAWTKAYGTRSRHKLTRHDCELLIVVWLTAKKSPQTIKHRVRVLKQLWHALDGPRTRTPLDGLKLPRIVKTLPAPVADETIIAVADSLKAGLAGLKRHGPNRTEAAVQYPEAEHAYARFLIRALSGQRPSQIGRAKREDVDRTNRIWWVSAGKGGNPVPFPLTTALDLAFVYFDKVNAWGPFDCTSFSRTLKRHGWPAGVRPYALRHSFAIGQLLAGTDLGDLQGLLGHADIATTRIYAPVLVSRLKTALERRTLKLVTK
jgi:integrase